MHQHRSSAAAISDPMMAATMTDQLASASGPLTGSGGALNQLGLQQQQPSWGAGYLPARATADYVQQQQQPLVADWSQQQPPQSGHTSRYDAHYSSGTRGHAHSGRYHSSSAATTAYQQQQQQAAYGGVADYLDSNYRYYNPAQGQPSAHQSLGNLTLGAGGSSRYAPDGYPPPLLDPHSLHARPSSMAAASASEGLGQYNPLDDPLLSGLGPPPGQQVAFGLGQQQQQHANSAAWALAGNPSNRDAYLTELRARLQELQASYAGAKRELETATQKLGSSMHSIKSFWSPELKKERALRKEEQTKYALINDQMKLMRVEVQVSLSLLFSLVSSKSVHFGPALLLASARPLHRCANLPDARASHFLRARLPPLGVAGAPCGLWRRSSVRASPHNGPRRQRK